MQSLLLPCLVDALMRGAVDTLVGDIGDPDTQLSAQIVDACGLPATQEIAAQIADATLDFALGLWPVRMTQARSEASVPSKVLEHRVPHDLGALIHSQHDRLDAIVEDLGRHATQLTKGLFVHPQKGD